MTWMKWCVIITVCLFSSGCMFVSGAYVPAEQGTGYEVEGTCVGISWEECLRRAEVLCAEVGQTVSRQMRAGGPENKDGIALVPKRISILCE